MLAIAIFSLAITVYEIIKIIYSTEVVSIKNVTFKKYVKVMSYNVAEYDGFLWPKR